MYVSWPINIKIKDMNMQNEKGSNSVGILAIAALVFAISAVYVAFATRADLNDRLALVQQNNNNLDQLADIDNDAGLVLGVAEENDSVDGTDQPEMVSTTQSGTVEVVEPMDDIRIKPLIISNLGNSTSYGVDLSALFGSAPSIVLANINNGEEVGKAWLAVYNGKTYLRIAARNLDEPYGSNYYEGWMVKNADYGIMFSAGKMEYNASTSEAVLSIEVEGDVSDYTTVLLTLEPDDGLARPYKILLRSSFPPGTDFVITDSMLEESAVAIQTQKSTDELQNLNNSSEADLLNSLLGSGNNQDELLKALLGGSSGTVDNSSISELLNKFR